LIFSLKAAMPLEGYAIETADHLFMYPSRYFGKIGSTFEKVLTCGSQMRVFDGKKERPNSMVRSLEQAKKDS
jgi:hypothetical protein